MHLQRGSTSSFLFFGDWPTCLVSHLFYFPADETEVVSQDLFDRLCNK